MPQTYKNPITGKEETVDLVNTNATEWDFWKNTIPFGQFTRRDKGSPFFDGYYYNNVFRTSNAEDVEIAVKYIMETGKYDEDGVKQALKKAGRGQGAVENELYEIIEDAKTYINKAGFNIEDITDAAESQNSGVDTSEDSANDAALNAFYQDAYSLEDGTTGKAIYDSLLQAEQDAALSNMELAEANYQRQAMRQAQTVKNITDQVRAERVARLRAGMSEAQIANQDMQTLMSNVNALNQQMADADVARLQAQQQYQNAQNTAYQAWLANANAMAQTGAAYAASNAGDIVQQALRYSTITGTPYKKSVEILNGSAQNQNKN